MPTGSDTLDDEELSDARVKDRVRKRDCNRCRKCGMTAAEHWKEHRQDLHVHRLIPGSVYSEGCCVTLCQACHGKMPRRAEDLIWKGYEETGVLVLLLNLFGPMDRSTYSHLERCAEEEGVTFEGLVCKILREWVSRQPDDYHI